MSPRGMLILTAAAFAAACGTNTPGGARGSGGPSGALVFEESSGLAFFADTDRGTVGILDLATDTTTHVEVGGEPHKLALTRDRLLVTRRAARSLLILRREGKDLVPDQDVEVGPEPGSVVTDASGRTAYVAVSVEGVVAVVDLERGAVRERLPVRGQPEWLLLHASRLWVGTRNTTREQALLAVDPATGASDPVPLPSLQPSGGASPAPDLPVRVTGDPIVSPDGDEVLVPVSYFDPPGDRGVFSPGARYYAARGMNMPGVVRVPTPEEDVRPEDATFVALPGSGSSVVAVSPDGEQLAVADPTARSLALLPRVIVPGTTGQPLFTGSRFVREETALAANPAAAPVGLGVKAVVFVGSRWVLAYSAFEHSVSVVDTRRAQELLGVNPWNVGATLANLGGARMVQAAREQVVRTLTVSTPSLPPDVARGRALFYDGETSVLAANGANVACATCHPAGRTDGMTWSFPQGRFQTPMTVGAALTLPLRWQGDRASIEDDVLGTARDLLGALGDLHPEARLVTRFIEHLREVDTPAIDPEQEARGLRLFESETAGCGSCHAGPRFTDGRQHPTRSQKLAIDTPSLLGLAASAPYLCDGRAGTLEEALVEHERDGHGRVSHLSQPELDDLVEFLRTR